MKLLITTAWWPTKTPFFERYAIGVDRLIRSGLCDQFFITTRFHDSKYGSNFEAIQQGAHWAIAHDFTHVLILDADVVLSITGLQVLIEADKEVILAGRGSGSGVSKMDLQSPSIGNIGWGCALYKVSAVKKCPMEYGGDFISPDRLWFKKLIMSGIEVWCHFDVVPTLLETSANRPMAAFSPKGEK